MSSRRHAPEEPREVLPLFDSPAAPRQAVQSARAQGHAAALAAADRAQKLDAGWKADALEAVERHCRTHARFLTEEVPIVIPEGADHRSSGHIVRHAARLGYCVADGFAPTVSSRGSAKVSWKSLLYEGAPT